MVVVTDNSYQGDDTLRPCKSNVGASTKATKESPNIIVAEEIWSSIKKTLFVLGSCIVIFIAVRNSLTL